MHTFQVGTAIKGGFQAFKTNFVSLITISLLSIALSIGGTLLAGGTELIESIQNADRTSTSEFTTNDSSTPGTFGFSANYQSSSSSSYEFKTSGGPLGFLLSQLISLVNLIMLTVVCLDAVMGRKFRFTHVLTNIKKFHRVLAAAILFAIITLLGLIPVVGWIGAPILFLMYSQTFPIIIEENKKVVEAFNQSQTLMTGNKLKLFGTSILLAILFGTIGLIILAVPFFFSFNLLFGVLAVILFITLVPLMYCIQTHIYKQLTQGPAAKVVEKAKEAIS